MPYYVLGAGGAKYGPADSDTLNTWIAAGRIAPETLIEDAGSGVKMPARAVPGLTFVAVPQSRAPASAPPTPAPLTSPHVTAPAPALHSTYARPGQAGGGSDSNLFLPGVNGKWALQSIACVAGALLCTAFIVLTHVYFGRFVAIAAILPLAGIQRGYSGISENRPLAVLLIVLNALTFVGTIFMLLRDIIA